MKFLKWLLILISVGISVIAITEILSYFRNPESYMLGSEAMVSNGGLYYKSKFTFLLINSLQIILSIFAIILFFKAKEMSGFKIPLLLVVLQILFLILT
ncbi:MAG: hypothetical protein K9I86_00010 [Cryomorphaceae bacterium]|nr:hypothetical protein [Cryomorphaceae bacterium]